MTKTIIRFVEHLSRRDVQDLADALAHSAHGRIVSCDDRRAIVETDDALDTEYLYDLCGDDDRVLYFA